MSADDLLKMAAPRTPIFVFSGTLPGTNGVGAIILKDLVDGVPEADLRFFGVLPRGHQPGPVGEVVGTAERRYETAYRPWAGTVGRATAALLQGRLFQRQLRQVVARAVAAGERVAPEFVWAILDCPTTIWGAAEVARRLGRPLRVLVWDDPAQLAEQLQYHHRDTLPLMRQFERTLAAAERVAVVGETMRDRYAAAYGIAPMILRHGLAESVSRPVNPRVTAEDRLIIGYAGSITAADTFAALIRTLDSVGWRIDGRDVVLRMMGVRYTLAAAGPQHIEYYGWRSVSETVGLLADCDVLYLPQPFATNARALAEFSFPTKLSTYLAAGRPVLLHGPDYGSVVPFFERYPCGEWCAAGQAEPLLDTLSRLRNDRQRRQSACAAVDAARREELSAAVFMRSFRAFAGLSERIVAPMAQGA